MDPFVSLSVAAAVTTTHANWAPACAWSCSAIRSRPPSWWPRWTRCPRGRFLFGIGGGWNAEEMADHGTTDFKGRWKLVRERVEAMKAIWTQETPEYHGELVDFGRR